MDGRPFLLLFGLPDAHRSDRRKLVDSRRLRRLDSRVDLGLAPLAWMLYKRSKRFRRFNVLLPDAIDLIARALRAGQSLPSALVTVAEEMADPVGAGISALCRRMNFGLPFREAMHEHVPERFPLQDLHF